MLDVVVLQPKHTTTGTMHIGLQWQRAEWPHFSIKFCHDHRAENEAHACRVATKQTDRFNTGNVEGCDRTQFWYLTIYSSKIISISSRPLVDLHSNLSHDLSPQKFCLFLLFRFLSTWPVPAAPYLCCTVRTTGATNDLSSRPLTV
jgi:hypothetical protein